MKKKLSCLSLQEELNKANADILKRKELKVLQEKAEEMKVIEFQKAKAVSSAVSD